MSDNEDVLVPRRSETAPLVKYTTISVDERDSLRARVAALEQAGAALRDRLDHRLHGVRGCLGNRDVIACTAWDTLHGGTVGGFVVYIIKEMP